MENIFHDAINFLFILFPSRSAYINEWKNKMNFVFPFITCQHVVAYEFRVFHTAPHHPSSIHWKLFKASNVCLNGKFSFSLNNIKPAATHHHSETRNKLRDSRFYRENSRRLTKISKELIQLFVSSVRIEKQKLAQLFHRRLFFYFSCFIQQKTFPHSVNELDETIGRNLITERKLWMSN